MGETEKFHPYIRFTQQLTIGEIKMLTGIELQINTTRNYIVDCYECFTAKELQHYLDKIDTKNEQLRC
jgi:hypothetical protein